MTAKCRKCQKPMLIEKIKNYWKFSCVCGAWAEVAEKSLNEAIKTYNQYYEIVRSKKA